MGNASTKTLFYHHNSAFNLSGGGHLAEFQLAYEIYGEMNEAKDNVVLLFHALSGSQHASGENTDPDGVIGKLWTRECHPDS